MRRAGLSASVELLVIIRDFNANFYEPFLAPTGVNTRWVSSFLHRLRLLNGKGVTSFRVGSPTPVP